MSVTALYSLDQFLADTRATIKSKGIPSGLAEIRGNTINAEKTFAEMAADKDYFLVTSFNQLDKQPDLKKILSGYPIAVEGDGFVLYDLR